MAVRIYQHARAATVNAGNGAYSTAGSPPARAGMYLRADQTTNGERERRAGSIGCSVRFAGLDTAVDRTRIIAGRAGRRIAVPVLAGRKEAAA